MTMIIIFITITPSVFSHSTNRFQAARDLRVSGLNGVLSGQTYFDSVGGCANYCALLDCEAFSTRLYMEDSGEKFRGVKCETAFSK